MHTMNTYVVDSNFNLLATKRDESEIQAIKPLLYRIAMSLGFNDQQLHTVVEEVCSSIIRDSPVQTNKLPMKILLIKRFVHRCVFIISSRLFQQAKRVSGEMPLSYRVVYELKTSIGLCETELAFVLNTSPHMIRERLSRALTFLNQH